MSSPAFNLEIAATAEVYRNHRLYLKPGMVNSFDIRIVPRDMHPVTLTSGFRVEVDFGRVLSASDIAALDAAPPPNFRTVRLNDSTLEFIWFGPVPEVSASKPILLPITIEKLTVPTSKPDGTIWMQMTIDRKRVGAAECDVSIVRFERESGSLPPVVVMWNDGVAPKLTVDQAGECSFAILNARLNRRGEFKPLVTDPWTLESGKTVAPRIRIGIPPSLHRGAMQSFSTGGNLKDVEIQTFPSELDRGWDVSRGANFIEVFPTAQNESLIGPDASLKVVLKNIKPTNTGVWSLSVTFIDLPHVSAATYVLPFEVVQPAVVLPTAEIIEFRSEKVPQVGNIPPKLQLIWCIEGSEIGRVKFGRPSEKGGFDTFEVGIDHVGKLTLDWPGKTTHHELTVFDNAGRMMARKICTTFSFDRVKVHQCEPRLENFRENGPGQISFDLVLTGTASRLLDILVLMWEPASGGWSHVIKLDDPQQVVNYNPNADEIPFRWRQSYTAAWQIRENVWRRSGYLVIDFRFESGTWERLLFPARDLIAS